MGRLAVVLVVVLLLALGLGLWWPLPENSPATDSQPSATTAEPSLPPLRPATAPSAAQGSPLVAERPPVSEAPVVELMPEEAMVLLDAQAIASLRDSMQRGDDRAPPIGTHVDEAKPDADDMASPEAYLAFEGRQERQLKAAFVVAATEEIESVQKAVEEARQQGLPPEQLLEGEEKLRRLQAMRAQLLAEDPALQALTQPAAPSSPKSPVNTTPPPQ